MDFFIGAFLLSCRFEKDGLVLFSKKTKSFKDFSFSVFSSPRDFDCENQVSVEGFLERFKKVFFVTEKGVVPGFLKRFQINIIPGSLESGFWSKSEGVLVLSENDFSGEYSQTGRWQPVRSKTSLEITTKNISHLRRAILLSTNLLELVCIGGQLKSCLKWGSVKGLK